jgi:hypothetical protein
VPAGRDAGPTFGLAHAWEELYIAEGSDWYWWYGDDRSSGDDETFDNLFRTHLRNVYKFIGQPAPPFLNVSVRGEARAGRYTPPISALNINVDGRCTNYFEWLGAGRYRADKEGGVMAASGKPLLDQIFFGYDRKNLCVRVDLHDEPLIVVPGAATGARSHTVQKVSFRFGDLRGQALTVNAADPRAIQFEGNWDKSQAALVEVAWDDVLELKVPFSALGLREKEELSFYIEVLASDRGAERFPRSCALQFTVPPENILEIEWMA